MAPAQEAGPRRDELTEVLRLVSTEAERYLADLDRIPVRAGGADDVAESITGDLPETGSGAGSALTELLEHSAGLIASSGPRYFHFVTGGVTPAALGADWLASLTDQNSGDWGGAPLTSQLESVSIRWLLDLFGLPAGWGGVLTTGATMANFVGLAAARRWWGLRQGVDIDEQGLAGLPRAACSRRATCIRATRRRSRCSAWGEGVSNGSPGTPPDGSTWRRSRPSSERWMVNPRSSSAAPER